MSIKSIELSDKIYEKLRAMKSEDESWDAFMSRLTESVNLIHPSKSEWEKAYKKAFKDHKEVFLKLAE